MWTSTFFLLFFVCLSLGVKNTEYQDEVPGHEGQCLGADKKFYKLGEKMPADSRNPCTSKTCRGSAQPGSVYIEAQGCPKLSKTPGCELKVDEMKSFPDCCARLECGRN